MPTYSYVCESCGHKFDQLQTMLDVALKTCPVCTEDTLKRLIGAGAGLIFKGSGFYITDYARKSGDNGHKSDGSDASGSTADSGKNDAKKSVSKSKSANKSKTD